MREARWYWVGVGVVVALFLLATAGTFTRGHSNGDQRVYVGMAMKLADRGMAGYQVHGVGMMRDGDWVVFRPVEGDGQLLSAFRADGTSFYDQPLMHAPPLLSLILAGANRLSGDEFRVLAHDRAEDSALTRSERWRGQWPAAGPPWLFGAALLGVTAWLARDRFDPAVALLATLALAVAPALWLASQRVWADTLLATASTLALVFASRAAASRAWGSMVACGVALAAALLTKNNAVIAVVGAVIVYLGARPSLDRGDAARWLMAAGIVIALTFFWYARAVEAFGTPFFNPSAPGIAERHAWFSYINARPWYTYLLGLPLQHPWLGLGVLASGWALVQRARSTTPLAAVSLLYIVVMTVATSTSEMLGPDHRYLLPAYPILAILGAHALVTLLRSLPRPGRWGLSMAAAGAWAWTLYVAWTETDADLITLPF